MDDDSGEGSALGVLELKSFSLNLLSPLLSIWMVFIEKGMHRVGACNVGIGFWTIDSQAGMKAILF